MTRGRKPLIALNEAKHIAEKRGEVRHFRHEPDMICNFVIYMIASVAHVRVRRVNRIRITPDRLEWEAAEDLATLRFIASSPGISRELWVHTPKGTFRFFRVLDNSLVELDRDGRQFPTPPSAGGQIVIIPADICTPAREQEPSDVRQVIRPGGEECRESSDLRQEKDCVLLQSPADSSREKIPRGTMKPGDPLT